MPIKLSGMAASLPEKFYNSLINTTNSLALNQLWLVRFDPNQLLSILSYINKNLQGFEGNKWEFNKGALRSLEDSWFAGNYYLMAQGVNFPGDGISVSRQGLNMSGTLRGPVMENRNELPIVTVTFLETNQSITDFFFRPWIIMAGHRGLKDPKLRIDGELVCFQKGGLGALVLNKTFSLNRMIPINTNDEEYNYSGSKVIMRPVQFVYNRYAVNDGFSARTTDIQNISDADAFSAFYNERAIPSGATLQQVVESLARTYVDVVGRVDRMEDESVRTLRALGLEKQATSVEKQFDNVRENLQPAGDVIETGNDVVEALGSFSRLIEQADIRENAQPNYDTNPPPAEIKPYGPNLPEPLAVDEKTLPNQQVANIVIDRVPTKEPEVTINLEETVAAKVPEPVKIEYVEKKFQEPAIPIKLA